MKNITLALEDEKLARLRVYAAQHRTTVNALFRKHTDDLLDGGERRTKARERLLELSMRSEAYDQANPGQGEGADRTFSREQTYTGRRFEWPRSD